MKPYQWILSLALLPKAIRVVFGFVGALLVLGLIGGMCSSSDHGEATSASSTGSSTVQSVQAARYPTDEEIWAMTKRYLAENCLDTRSGRFLAPGSDSEHHKIRTGGHELWEGRKVYHYTIKGWFDTTDKGKTVRAHFGIDLLAYKTSQKDSERAGIFLSNGWTYEQSQHKCVPQRGKLTEEHDLEGFDIDLPPVNPEALLPER